jgi:8-amino-7-oxononanoate synthase
MNKIKTDLVNFAGNDYLGLARDVRLVEAMCRAAQEYGISSTSSRWALGWTDIHQELETKLADFFRVEDATILGAAYLGGPVYFSSMSETHRVVFCDEMVHSNQFLRLPLRVSNHWKLSRKNQSAVKQCGNAPGG